MNKSGLPRAELLRQRVHATVELDAEGVVLRYAITPGAHPKFDAAARAALDAIVGERVPSPPEQYPGALQRRLAVTFVCTESTCD
ncbi:MAG: hypothetical protein H6713_23720 [Myxococcales bacterium]|nr:hypothetical protein [Myxococcales bacterium]